MRIASGAVSALLILFAAAQMNDPDGPLWPAIYGGRALDRGGGAPARAADAPGGRARLRRDGARRARGARALLAGDARMVAPRRVVGDRDGARGDGDDDRRRRAGARRARGDPGAAAGLVGLRPVLCRLRAGIRLAGRTDGEARVFIVERAGRVKIVNPDGSANEEPFLDLTAIDPLGSVVQTGFVEQGLYSIAFHPDHEENGYVFAHYAPLPFTGDGMIVRCTLDPESPDAISADRVNETAKVVMRIEQPWYNHNGGQIAFGPDGYLYIGSGDGGWEGDPPQAGKDLSTDLGEMLCIDVDVPDEEVNACRIPPDNPFAEAQMERLMVLFGITEEEFAEIRTEADPATQARGVRNPDEFAFDPATGDLFIADVGARTTGRRSSGSPPPARGRGLWLAGRAGGLLAPDDGRPGRERLCLGRRAAGRAVSARPGLAGRPREHRGGMLGAGLRRGQRRRDAGRPSRRRLALGPRLRPRPGRRKLAAPGDDADGAAVHSRRARQGRLRARGQRQQRLPRRRGAGRQPAGPALAHHAGRRGARGRDRRPHDGATQSPHRRTSA